jgi:hypothetical protein
VLARSSTKPGAPPTILNPVSWGLFAGRRVRAPLWHAAASLLVAVAVSSVIFLVWFPGAYARITGGSTLFLIIVAVDVISGPLLTAVISDPAKPIKVFRRDVVVIAIVQLVALAYGVHVLSLARPVITIFEVDRMRVLSAAEIDDEDLQRAPEGLRELSWTGPRVLAAASPQTREEQLRAIDLAIGGLDISNDPKNWRLYDTQSTAAWNRAKPATQLEARYPAARESLEQVVKRAGVPLERLRFLPLASRQGFGSAVLAPPDFRVVEVLAFDGFF